MAIEMSNEDGDTDMLQYALFILAVEQTLQHRRFVAGSQVFLSGTLQEC
jgi:hypothetical protein